MQKVLTFYDTTVGKKAVMALTGFVLFGFVIGHMLGNLQVFLGPAKLNGYAKSLRDLGALLWAARAVLLISVVAHIVAAYQLVTRSMAARGHGYRQRKNQVTGYAGITMKLSGPILLLFILYHLAHFTFPGVPMGNYQHSAHDVYSNVIQGFSLPWVVAIYVAAQLCLGLHLYHGGVSMLQSLGLSHPRYNQAREWLPQTVAIAVTAGNIVMPISVLMGLVK